MSIQRTSIDFSHLSTNGAHKLSGVEQQNEAIRISSCNGNLLIGETLTPKRKNELQTWTRATYILIKDGKDRNPI